MKLVLLALALLAAAAASPALAAAWQRNARSLDVFSSLVREDPAAQEAALARLGAGSDCASAWQSGVLYHSLGDVAQRDERWLQATGCDPQYLSLAQAMAPQNDALAERVTAVYPNLAGGWFWRAGLQLDAAPEQAARLYAEGLRRAPDNPEAWVQLGHAVSALDPQAAPVVVDSLHLEEIAGQEPEWQAEAVFIQAGALAGTQPEEASRLYRAGLALKPLDGVRWYLLGDLLSAGEPQAALEAYLNSCRLGDPGAHGCYGAGRMAEQLGDFPAAIRYYRMSLWETARQRAAELEQQP